tara:strand:+ start:375 stop:758 length:384 start_codon:yes stop_codon:yes gene_type:complete
MSKASEIAGWYAMSKKAMLIGLGYFAATNPRGTVKFLMRVAPPLVHSMARDSYLIIREAGKELVLPEARQVAKNIGRATSQAARPMIWGGLAQPTFILMGGALAQIIHMGAEDFLEFFGMDEPTRID